MKTLTHINRSILITGFLLFLSTYFLKAQLSFFGGIDGSINRYYYSFNHIPIRELDSPNQYGYDFHFGVLVNERFYFRTGLARMTHGLNIIFDWYAPGMPNITDPSIPIQSFYNYSYLSIPISIGYKFQLHNRVKIIPQIGTNFLFITNSTEYSIMGDGSTEPIVLDLYSLNSDHIQICAIVTCEVFFTDKWFVNLEPFICKSHIKQPSPYLETSYYTIGGLVGINRVLRLSSQSVK